MFEMLRQKDASKHGCLRGLIVATWLAASAIGWFPVHAAAVMEPDFADGSSGIVFGEFPSEFKFFRGSGVVAQNPRLVFTAAHVLFDDGRWATNTRFVRAWNSQSAPGSTEGVKARGFRYFSSYASFASSVQNSEDSFNLDFAVLYGNSRFGTAVGWWPNGGPQLTSDHWKVCRGYPATIDFTKQPGFHLQHSTGAFTDRARQLQGAYYWFDEVGIGSGASGGPCYRWDAKAAAWLLAGQLVSGAEGGGLGTGVRALDAGTRRIADAALGSESPVTATKNFANRRRVELPDNGWWVSRHVQVSNHPGRIYGLVVDVDISTTYRGDLMAVLRSPTRRVRWLTNRQGSNSQDFKRSFRLAPRYLGFSAEGDWALVMRDAAAEDRAVFHSVSLRITNQL